MDLFRFPWDFKDNSVEQFYCSHIIEHIPHETYPAPAPTQSSSLDWNKRWEELKGLGDGFFAFFAEVWRIAKPGAKVEIVCPYGLSYGALQDPTHTRYLVPPSFAYLTTEIVHGETVKGMPNTFNYHLPFLFKTTRTDIEILPHPAFMQAHSQDQYAQSQADALVVTQFNIGYNMHVDLEVIKCDKCGGNHETLKHESPSNYR